MEMLITRLEKERVQYRQQMHSELEAQRVQMQNMMASNMKQAEREREAFIKDNQALEERFLDMQRSNEENMKLIRNMTALIARQHKEKEVLRENAKELPRDKMEGLLYEMSERHTDEVRALLKETDDQFEGAKKLKQETSDEGDDNTCHKNLDEVPEMIKLRSEAVEDVQKKITETHQEQEEVETSSYIKKGLKVIARTAVPIGQIISIFHPETAPFAVPASAAIGTAAEALSNECSIMWSFIGSQSISSFINCVTNKYSISGKDATYSINELEKVRK